VANLLLTSGFLSGNPVLYRYYCYSVLFEWNNVFFFSMHGWPQPVSYLYELLTYHTVSAWASLWLQCVTCDRYWRIYDWTTNYHKQRVRNKSRQHTAPMVSTICANKKFTHDECQFWEASLLWNLTQSFNFKMKINVWCVTATDTLPLRICLCY